MLLGQILSDSSGEHHRPKSRTDDSATSKRGEEQCARQVRRRFGVRFERRFWEQISTGITSERAAEAVGVSPVVGSRWFCHRGVMPLFMSRPVSGRYLSFAEREEIGLLCAQGVGVREPLLVRASVLSPTGRSETETSARPRPAASVRRFANTS